MVETALTMLAVVTIVVMAETGFVTLMRIHRWLRPPVPGWFKPDLRDADMPGWLGRMPRAPIRYWRWDRRRHEHTWGKYQLIRLPWERTAEARTRIGRGCSTCPTIELIDRQGWAEQRFTMSQTTVSTKMLRAGQIPFD